MTFLNAIHNSTGTNSSTGFTRFRVPHCPGEIAGPNRSSESLPVMYTAVHNLVAQGFVCTLGYLILDQGIGSHLDTAVTASPLLRFGQQFPAHTTLAVIFGNVPALNVSHGP